MKNLLCYRTVFFVIALYFCLSSAPAFAQIKTLDEAINIAGKQRTLTQQMLKNYSLIGMKVRARKAKQELEQEMATFDRQFVDLKSFSTEAMAQKQLTTVNELWLETKVIYSADPDKSQLANLNSKTDKLFNATEQLLLTLVKASPDDKSRLLNIASTEQMLTQRIVALYALKAWGFAGPYQAGYNKAVAEFEQGLKDLLSNPNNKTKMKAVLAQITQHFKRLNATITAGTSGSYSLAIASVSAETFFSEIEKIILEYQQPALN